MKRGGRHLSEITNHKKHFINSRSLFEKKFHEEKRRYSRKWQVNINNLNHINPYQFREEMNKSKPRTQCKFAMDVNTKTGDIVTDPKYVIGKVTLKNYTSLTMSRTKTILTVNFTIILKLPSGNSKQILSYIQSKRFLMEK